VLGVVVGCGRPPEVRDIPAERDGGQVRLRTFTDRQEVEITSPKGIGAADVPLARPPLPIHFSFRLRALEQLRLTYSDVEIIAVVKPSGEMHQSVRQAGAATRPISVDDPFWMPVHIEREHGGAGAQIARIDLDGPAALHETAPESCRIDWVDFFR
jgi:hypothetical protein